MAGREPDEPTEFGQYLVDAMKAHKPQLGRPQLAELVGVDATTISRWIMKDNKPQTDKLHLLADALNLDHGEVLARAGHGRPSDNVQAIEPEWHPLARELNRMLDQSSPLTDAERERTAIVVDAAIESNRPKMRRTRRAG
jgi:transcriptional regulator with XRE-family HTH domain